MIKRKSNYILLFILIISLLLFSLNAGIISVFANEEQRVDINVYDENCEIATDSVIVTLTKEETRKFKTYTESDFSEINCISVEELTQSTVDVVQSTVNNNHANANMMVTVDNYKRILKLNLQESTREEIYNVVDTLNQKASVEQATPNYVNVINAVPNDPYMVENLTWGLNETTGISAEKAWQITFGNNTVRVGIVDTGVDASHPDLVGKMNQTGLHRDFTKSTPQISLNEVVDTDGHGTHIAGIIGAHANNQEGISGVCWNVEIVSLRVAVGETIKNEDIIEAIDYAASQNIPILNCSFGGSGYNSSVKNAINQYNGLLVCAAGNDGTNNDTTPHYPSHYSYNYPFSDRVISVGEHNRSTSPYTTYNYGENTVSVYAPGVNILSTYPTNLCAGEKVSTSRGEKLKCECEYKDGVWIWKNGGAHHENGYHYESGTSMAAPYVTGVAALLLSTNPSLSAQEIKEIIIANADDVELTIPGGGKQTVKKLNAFQAISSIAFDTNAEGNCITGINFNAQGEICVPKKIDGVEISAIASGVFENQTQLTGIDLPYTITSIGARAFSGCCYLEKIEIPTWAQSIGEEAFVNCIALNNVIIPTKVTSIGARAFQGCASLAQVNISANITNIGENAFSNCENLTNVRIHSNAKGISNSAFAGCENIIFTLYAGITEIEEDSLKDATFLTNITIPSSVTSIGARAFHGCTSLMEITIPSSVTNIGLGAFSGCKDLIINVDAANDDYAAEDNVLYNKEKTKIIAVGNMFAVDVPESQRVPQTITIPSTVNTIGSYAFYNNPYVGDLIIENGLNIQAYAFSGCENLDTVYFYTEEVPSVGTGAFPTNQIEVYAPYDQRVEYYYALDPYIDTIGLIPVQITLVSQGETIGTTDRYYGETLLGMMAPSRIGYDFDSWYSEENGNGVRYGNGCLLTETQNVTVYAHWLPKTYHLVFTGEGSEELSPKQVTYGAAVGELPEAIAPEGYVFNGWKTAQGDYVTSETIWQTANYVTVYPEFCVAEYAIYYYDNYGGYVEEDTQTVTHGAVVNSLSTAYLDGWIFTGWCREIDGELQPVATPFIYNFTTDIELFAQYVENEYDVAFDKQGGIGGSDGADTDTYEIVAPTKPGYIFRGYFEEPNGYGSQYVDEYMYVCGDLSSVTVLYAYWEVKEYYVTIDNQGGDGYYEDIWAVYFGEMPSLDSELIPYKDGYEFAGYFENADGTGLQYYDSALNPVGVWNQDCEGDGVIYAHWVYGTYLVELDQQGGAGGTGSIAATYQSAMPFAVAPIRERYTFGGYYEMPNGQGAKYYNADMTSARAWDKVQPAMLYAYWYGRVCDVSLVDNSAIHNVIQVAHGSAMPSDIAPLSKAHYVFLGYFDENGKQYYDGNMVGTCQWDKQTDALLYARWEAEKYNIQYCNLQFMGQTATVYWTGTGNIENLNEYQYGVGLNLYYVKASFQTSSVYSPQLVFLGWYATMDFSADIHYLSATRTGPVIVYAKWRYDYTSGSRTADYTITDTDPYTTAYYDNFYINFGTTGLHQALLDIGITKVYLEFKIGIREVNDGYQEIMIYDGTSSTARLLCSCTNIEHGPGDKDTTEKYYKFTVCFDIDDILNVNTLIVRYSAHGSGNDNWVTSEIYYETMYIKDNADVTAQEFTWEHQDTIDDSICNQNYTMTYHV